MHSGKGQALQTISMINKRGLHYRCREGYYDVLQTTATIAMAIGEVVFTRMAKASWLLHLQSLQVKPEN